VSITGTNAGALRVQLPWREYFSNNRKKVFSKTLKLGTMLASDKIATAFIAIVEEAEKLIKAGPGQMQLDGLKTIISIARHQSDIRGMKPGDCPPHSSCKKG
jgi:hypothetical protein